MKQQSLFIDKRIAGFGGSLTNSGKRKMARPLSFKSATHLVLKAENKVQLFQYSLLIREQIRKISRKFGVKIYDLAIHEDHIHGIFKFPNRVLYRAWIRSLSGILARLIVGLKWRLRPFTKVIAWGKQFKTTLANIKSNRDEPEFLKLAWVRSKQFEI